MAEDLLRGRSTGWSQETARERCCSRCRTEDGLVDLRLRCYTTEEKAIVCISCLVYADSKGVKMGKQRVDLEEVERLEARRKEINDIPFEELEVFHKGKKVEYSEEIIEEWKYMGMSHFCLINFYGDGTGGENE